MSQKRILTKLKTYFIISEQFINPYVDYGFKKLFGTEENKELLISFLNAMIFNKEGVISSLTYKNVEQLGDIKKHRNCYFDVYCVTNDGTSFIVEMQNAKQDYFKDRSLFYATKPIRDQAEKGQDWDFRLENVYMVGVMNFKFPDNEYPKESYYHEVKLIDVVDHHVFYDKLTLIYLEMPKLKDAKIEPETLRDKWLLALNSLCYTDERLDVLQEDIFNKLYNTALLANLNETQLYAYEQSQKNMWDYNNTIRTARKDGVAEGIAQAKLNMALKMKTYGIDLATICQITGVTESEILENKLHLE